MKIYDENDNLIENPDLKYGRLKEDKKTVHHEAVDAVEEKSHYETLAEYSNGGKSVRKVVDVEGVEAKDAYDEEVDILRYVLYTADELKALVDHQKELLIEDSKSELSDYLATHPLLWTDGKYYSVTSEKQSLLTSNLALYQISATAGMPFKLTWNSTGDECVEQTYENLATLALAIGTYVKPFVSHQQELELAIKACTTYDELNAIEISYGDAEDNVHKPDVKENDANADTEEN